MLRRLGQVFVICALVVSIGAHWALLQSVAWVGMAVRFAQTDPLPEALSKTFDGQHPCALCKVVSEGREADTQKPTIKADAKLDFMLPAAGVAVERPARFLIFPGGARFALDRLEAPPLPPPRLA